MLAVGRISILNQYDRGGPKIEDVHRISNNKICIFSDFGRPTSTDGRLFFFEKKMTTRSGHPARRAVKTKNRHNSAGLLF